MLALLLLLLLLGLVFPIATASTSPANFNLDDFRAFKALSHSLHREAWRDCNTTTASSSSILPLDPCSVCSPASSSIVLCETVEFNVTVLVNVTSAPTTSSPSSPALRLRRRQLATTTTTVAVKQLRQETRIVGLRLRNLGISAPVPVLALSAFAHLRELDLSNDRSAPYHNLLTPPGEEEACVRIPRCYWNQITNTACDLGALVVVCRQDTSPAALVMPAGALAGAVIGGTLGGLLLVLALSCALKQRFFRSTAEELAERKAKAEKRNRSISRKQRKAMEKERLRQERHQKKLAAARTRAQNGGAEIVTSNKKKRGSIHNSHHPHMLGGGDDAASVRSHRTLLNAAPSSAAATTAAATTRSAAAPSDAKSVRSSKSRKSRGGKVLLKQKSAYSSLRTRVAKQQPVDLAASGGGGAGAWTERLDSNGTKYWINLTTGVASTTPPRDAFAPMPSSSAYREASSNNSGLRSLRGGGLRAAAAPRQPHSHDYDDLDEPNYAMPGNVPMNSAPGGFGAGMSSNPMFQGSMDPRTGQFTYQ